MSVQLDPAEVERKLSKVFEFAARAHEEIYECLRRHYPDATDDELFERYCGVIAHRRAGKYGEPWSVERDYTKKFLEEWKRKRCQQKSST
ncbi:MAG: hypothetical protein KDA93_07190 [Planctomycetaceae bacterium]|nr:hypothetical protein [Planctomycetaceae bacterium]